VDQPPAIKRTPNLEPFLGQSVPVVPYTTSTADPVSRKFGLKRIHRYLYPDSPLTENLENLL
jgi:hypothetical protein